MPDHAARLAALSAEKRALLTRRLAALPRETSAPVPRPRHVGVNTFPTSYAQERLWFLQELAPDSVTYNVAGAFHVHGRLDVAALRASFEMLMARHESLRTTVVGVEGRPVQVVSPRGSMAMTITDLTDASSLTHAETRVAEEVQRPFDVAHGPLLRLRVFVLTSATWVVALTMHHLIADAWSITILVRELVTLYRDVVRGVRPSLPCGRLQYADYAVWQRGRYAGARGEALVSYWRRQLEGAAYPAVALGARWRGRGAAERMMLPAVLTPAVRDLARRLGVTVFVVMLAAWKTVLKRCAGSDDVTVLVPVANRERSELAAIVGCFVNVVAVRTQLDGDPSFRAVVARVNGVTRAALQHQELPFELVVSALGQDRTLRRPPISPYAFALEQDAVGAIDLPGVDVVPLPLEVTTSKTDLALIVSEGAAGLAARLEYDRELHRAPVVMTLLRAYVACLERIVSDPDVRLSTLAGTLETVPSLIGGTTAAGDGTSPWARCMRRARVAPSAVAIRAGGATVTYEELMAGARGVAAQLEAEGVGRGAIVGVWTERSAAWAQAMLGIWGRGAVYLPLDPRWPAGRVVDVLTRSRATVVLVDAARPTRWLADTACRVVPIEDAVGVAGPSREGEIVSDPCDLAYVIFTSGSTGMPKGALVEHAGLHNHLAAKRALLGIGVGDRVAQTAALGFDISLWQCLAPLVAGAEVEILGDEVVRDPVALHAAIATRGITILELVPVMLRALLDVDEAMDPSCAGLLTSLRWLLVTGEALPPDLCRRWLVRYPAIPLVNAYGPTECADDVTHHVVRTPPAAGELRVPIGEPIPGMTVHVLDELLRPVADGEPGEICVGGVGVGRGYLHDPERTAAAFVIPDPFTESVGTRLYRTGDRGRRRSDGALEWLGRLDDQVKIRGTRVEPAEVEAVVGTHPAVRAVAVVAHDVDAGREPHAQLVAHVEVQGEHADLEATLRRHVAERLPEAMLPSTFALWTALPLTANGKIDREALASWRRDTAPALGRVPTTPGEQILARLWREILGREVTSVDEGFFALGGDSLSTIRLVASARRHGLVLTPRQVLEHQTIAALAAIAATAVEPSAEQGIIVGDVPWTPIQRMLLAADLPDLHHYNMSMLLTVGHRLSSECLSVAVEHLMRQHDALRLRLHRDGVRSRQLIVGLDGAVPHLHLDLSDQDDHTAAVAIEATAEEAQRSLDLAAGPILRVVSFDLGDDRASRVLVVVHHLACDAASWLILLEDLATVYDQVRHGHPIVLPAKTTSYRTWARRLAEHAFTPERRDEAGFWQRECAEPGARIPSADAQAAPSVADLASLSVSLAPDETERVLSTSTTVGVTLEAVLLTALATAVTDPAGDDRLVVFLERHGREALFADVDVSRTVGWFTAVFPVCLRIGDGRRPAETLAIIDRHLRAIPDGGIGWGLLGYGDQAAPREWQGLGHPAMSCNYLGRIDPPSVLTWAVAPESPGREVGHRGTRPTAVDLVAHLAEDRFHVTWHYDARRYERAVIAAMADRCLAVMRELSEQADEPLALEHLSAGRTS